MATVLHLLKTGASPLAADTIRREAAAGDAVTVVLLDGAPAPEGLDDVRRLRVPDGISYAELLDLVFDAERVIAW